MPHAPRDGGLFSDLGALRRWFWLPILTITIAVLAALAIGSVASPSSEARFRSTVLVDALPPLFGPPVLPGPVEYAALATDDTVVGEVSRDTGIAPDALRARMTAAPRFTQPQIDFTVTGPNALAIARVWRDAVNDAVIRETPGIELKLAQPYQQQLIEARSRLTAASAAAAGGADPVAQQELKAAEENYETAARLSQSYNVVSATMQAQLLPATGPHLTTGGVGSTGGRLGAAVALGLIAGVIGALALEALSRRSRSPETAFDGAPADLPRVGPASRSR